MGKGQIYQDPQFRYLDSYSEREILRLTDYLGHSNHFSFTYSFPSNPGLPPLLMTLFQVRIRRIHAHHVD
jgi:hypothetical protein